MKKKNWLNCIPWVQIMIRQHWFRLGDKQVTRHYGEYITSQEPLLLNGLTLIQAWIGNHMLSKVWHEIIYPIIK